MIQICWNECVYPNHSAVWNHNKSRLLETNQYFPVAKIKALCQGVHANSISTDKSGGLSHTIYLCKRSKVMLTVNLCVNFGLYNGACGTVIDIIYLNGNHPSEALPDIVVVDFPHYKGPAFIDEMPTAVPITPV